MTGQLSQQGANRAVMAGVGQSVSAEAGMYLGLGTAIPTDPDTADLAAWGTAEVSDSGYSRATVSWTAPAGDPSQIETDADITFGPFNDTVGEVGWVFLTSADSGTSGDVLAYWEATTHRTPDAGDSIRINAGDLTLDVD